MKIKRRISVAAAKDKGRRLQKWVAEKISEVTHLPWGKDELIASRPMGQAGTDVVLKGEAIKLFPFSCECKYQESWSIPAWIEQAKTNILPNTEWLLFIKKNKIKPLIVMDAEIFFKIYAEVLKND